MKIELTTEEMGMVLIDFLSKRNGIYEKGEFDIEWKIAAATGQPSFLVGASITINSLAAATQARKGAGEP